jgi:hypothetical protein
MERLRGMGKRGGRKKRAAAAMAETREPALKG